MITDNQVRNLKKYLCQGKPVEISAARSGMDEKTARNYVVLYDPGIQIVMKTHIFVNYFVVHLVARAAC